MALTISVTAESETFFLKKEKSGFFFTVFQENMIQNKYPQIPSEYWSLPYLSSSEQKSKQVSVNDQYWMRNLCVQEQFWQNPQLAVTWLGNKCRFLLCMGQALFSTASPQGWLIFLCVLRESSYVNQKGWERKSVHFFCVITTINHQNSSATFFYCFLISFMTQWDLCHKGSLCCMKPLNLPGHFSGSCWADFHGKKQFCIKSSS